MAPRRFDRSRILAYGPWFVVLAAACGGGSGSDAPPAVGDDGSTRPTPDDDAAPPDGSGSVGPSGDAASAGDDAGTPSTSDDASSQPSRDASNGSADGAASCAMTFPAVTDFGAKGPFDVAIDCSPPTTITADGTGCAIYHPTTMGKNGLKHPVIVWGNGTAAPAECNADAHVFGEYDYLFNQWASQGFIVAVANTDSTGSGTDMLDCLNWVEQQNSV